MSWLSTLYETYEQAMSQPNMADDQPMPISHTLQNAHINIVLDGEGNFRRARILEKTQIVLPATEKSAGRTANEAPHPLADKILYVAGDYASHGGLKKAYAEGYKNQLRDWLDSDTTHPSLPPIYTYISKNSLVADLVREKILWETDHVLLTSWTDENIDSPLIFKVLPKDAGFLDQGSALVCWTVESSDIKYANTWLDPTLQAAWIAFDAKQGGISSLCYITGKIEPIALNHPAKLRHSGDKAKLISSNDLDGYTYKGRFTDSKKSIDKVGLQAAAVGNITTQKAHNALRWLIRRQGKRNEDQVIVAWAVSSKHIPQPTDDLVALDDEYLDDFSDEEKNDDHPEPEPQSKPDQSINLGIRYADKLKLHMQGYHQKLEANDTISIISIDSATPGRMGVTYYRESMPADYLNDISAWHNDFAWPQRVKKETILKGGKTKDVTSWPIKAPSPYSILNAVYGDVLKSSKPLAKQLYQRLLPCLLERVNIPLDIQKLAFNQACKTSNKEYWEWERNIGVACSLYKGYSIRHSDQNKRRDFSMALDTTITSRDYLYGRLLALAEKLESTALFASGAKRPTTANRLMQRFADRPYSTWLTIYKQLDPYIRQLSSSRDGFLNNIQNEIDEVSAAFNRDDFMKDKALTGEFLLGFHCQRLALRVKKSTKNSTESKQGE
jgi:CRISPR-associated protein Csd1